MSFGNLFRVAHLFFMDILFKTSFWFPDLADIVFTVNNDTVNSTLSQIVISEFTQYYKVIRIILSCVLFCSSSVIFILPDKYLNSVYFHVGSISSVFLSYWLNIQALNYIYGEYEVFKTDFLNTNIECVVDGYFYSFGESPFANSSHILLFNLILQNYLSQIFEFLLGCITDQSMHKVSSITFKIPTLITLLPGTQRLQFFYTVTMLSTLLPLLIILKSTCVNLFTTTKLFSKNYYRTQQIIANNELLAFTVKMNWHQLKIPSVLLIFWAIRVLKQILITDAEIQNKTLFGAVNYLLIKGCDTFPAVLGMTSFISYICHYIVAFFKWVLLTNDVDNKSIGIISAVLFLMKALQAGLTGLDPEKRLIKLNHIICLLYTSLLYYIQHMVDPLLKSSSNFNTPSQNRALSVSGFLLVLPITMLLYLWYNYSFSTWPPRVSLLSIEIIVRVLVSLAVYSLFVIDAYHTTFWEKLDDYEYYIKSIGNTVEICLGIILFLEGVDSMDNVSVVSVINASLMLYIHVYINIWRRAKNEWEEFTKRSIAMKKIERLPLATNIQLSEIDDVCAICYQNMQSAKITRCNHYFHGICLRKLVYTQQSRCPLCQNNIY